MLLATAGQERKKLGFTEAVNSQFNFLVEELHFTCKKSETTFVRYESDKVFVNVYHGRSSFELNVEIGKLDRGGIPENPFTIGEILHVADPQNTENYHPYQTSAQESVKTFVDELARLVKRYALPALCGDQDFLQKVSDECAKRSDQLVLTWEMNRIRRDADTAWREKNFERVIALFAPVQEHLSPAEIKKLQYAKKQRRS